MLILSHSFSTCTALCYWQSPAYKVVDNPSSPLYFSQKRTCIHKMIYEITHSTATTGSKRLKRCETYWTTKNMYWTLPVDIWLHILKCHVISQGKPTVTYFPESHNENNTIIVAHSAKETDDELLLLFNPETLLYDVWNDSRLCNNGVVASWWLMWQIFICFEIKITGTRWKLIQECMLAKNCFVVVVVVCFFLLVPEFSKFEKSNVNFWQEKE